MNNVIPFHYQGQSVRFNSDGWINTTDVAKRFSKKPACNRGCNSETSCFAQCFAHDLQAPRLREIGVLRNLVRTVGTHSGRVPAAGSH